METIDPELNASQEKNQRHKLRVSRDMKSYQEQGHNDPLQESGLKLFYSLFPILLNIFFPP